jgi:hypothetical protein
MARLLLRKNAADAQAGLRRLPVPLGLEAANDDAAATSAATTSARTAAIGFIKGSSFRALPARCPKQRPTSAAPKHVRGLVLPSSPRSKPVRRAST